MLVARSCGRRKGARFGASVRRAGGRRSQSKGSGVSNPAGTLPEEMGGRAMIGR